MKRVLAASVAIFMGLMFMVGFAPAAATESVSVCETETVKAFHPEFGMVRASTTGDDCSVYLATYQLPKTWDGEGWNETASPQKLFAVELVVLTDVPTDFYATLPECGGVQVDLVYETPPATITYPEGIPGEVINGQHFTVEGECTEPTPTDTPTPTDKPTPTDTPTDKPSDSPTPQPTPEPTKPDKPEPELPDTGANMLLVLAGGALVAAGGATLWLTRKV